MKADGEKRKFVQADQRTTPLPSAFQFSLFGFVFLFYLRALGFDERSESTCIKTSARFGAIFESYYMPFHLTNASQNVKMMLNQC